MRCASFIVFLFVLLAAGCETVITVELQQGEPKVVVEGSIENGRPPVVILSRSFPFFGDVNINDVTALLLKGAEVRVSSAEDSVVLMEYDIDALEALSDSAYEAIIPVLEQYLGFEIKRDILVFLPDITFYTVAPEDLDFVGEIGQGYDLDIRFSDHELFGDMELSATTFIPYPVSLDSVWMEPHPNAEIDTLYQMRARLKDPDTSGNYYRLFTRVNGSSWLTTDNSVFDDAFINGESVPFTVFRGQTEREKLEEGDFDVDGYWEAGDSVVVRLSMIDEAHYDFWRTVENEKGNLGNPFGSFTVLASNVVNGVGVWGGYATTYVELVVEAP